MRERVSKRLGADADAVIAAFKTGYPNATPWDLNILIATDHPRGRVLTRAREAQGGPERRTGVSLPLRLGDPRRQRAHAVAAHDRDPVRLQQHQHVGSARSTGQTRTHWPRRSAKPGSRSHARGDPNTTRLPKWPAYSAEARDTMLFNNDSRVAQDPDRGPADSHGARAEALVRTSLQPLLAYGSNRARSSGDSRRQPPAEFHRISPETTA